MDNKKTKDIPVQGAEVVKGKKKQAKSVSYAVKALSGHVETLVNEGHINGEDKTTIAGIIKRAKESYIKKEYGL